MTAGAANMAAHMPGRALIDEGIADGSVDTVVVAFPDMHGRPVGKRVTAEFFSEHVAEHGIEACDYLLAVDVDMNPLPGYRFTNWDTGYGDVVCLPDYDTARTIPWLPGTAMVVCDLQDEAGAPVEVSPRQMLRRQLERAAERGLRVCSATELEFFLFQDSYASAAEAGWRGLTPHTSTIEDYQLLQTAREEYVLRRIRNEMRAADIPVEFSKGEAGRGQHEVNVTYDEALSTADRHLVFKNGIKEIAAQEGRAATFMAKWTMDDVGSSCHVHTSLWDIKSGVPLMADSSDGAALSTLGRRFLAGQIHAAKELAWCAAPTVNSYRRYVPGSWAPTAAVWGEDNRTCGFRVVGHGAGRRVESRIPGADVNPYIVLAASIAAGLYGVDHELDPGEPYGANAYEATDVPRIPSTLVEAIEALRSSEVALEAFGADVHHHLLNTAEQEWLASNRHVTDWELARNFERI
ncbi:MAG TPA: glutamine synthetase family protein [Acidimicrobiales bacterium]|nr:glutamine synthetase family protein [Acidimicrobiales bacterium]